MQTETEVGDGRRWYVLQTEPRREESVHGHLVGRRFKCYLPHVQRVTTRGVRRTKAAVLWPMFPGYLFVRLPASLEDEPRLHFVTFAPGVHRFLSFDGAAATVPCAQMERISQVEEQLLRPRPVETLFEVGETVRISEGPFTGFNAQIERLDDLSRITVLLDLLGRKTPMHLQAEALEKL